MKIWPSNRAFTILFALLHNSFANKKHQIVGLHAVVINKNGNSTEERVCLHVLENLPQPLVQQEGE